MTRPTKKAMGDVGLKGISLGLLILGSGGCTPKQGPSTVSTNPEQQLIAEGPEFKPHFGFCSPDRVQTFEVVQSEPTTTFGFTEEQPRVKVRIDLNDEGLVQCGVKDCSLTILKPIALDRAVPLGLGVALNVQLTVQGQKQVDQPSEKKINAGVAFTPLNVGIASVSVGLAGEYSKWREQNRAQLQDGQIQLRRKFGFNSHVKLGLPTIEVEIGLTNQGVYYRLVGDTAMGTKFKLGKVSTRYLESKASIDYQRIPRATLRGMESLLYYLTGSGMAQFQGVSERLKKISESCRSFFASPCRSQE